MEYEIILLITFSYSFCILKYIGLSCTLKCTFKNLLNVHFFFFLILPFFFLAASRTACGILVPQPGIEPLPPAVESWVLNHWTTMEVPAALYFFLVIFGSAGSSLLCGLFSLAVGSGVYSLVVARGFLVAVASLVAEHRP